MPKVIGDWQIIPPVAVPITPPSGWLPVVIDGNTYYAPQHVIDDIYRSLNSFTEFMVPAA